MGFTYEDAKAIADTNGQAHILRFWDDLTDEGKAGLLAQIEDIDFEMIARMRDMLGDAGDAADVGEFGPADVVPLSEADDSGMIEVGEKALAAGEIGVLLVAGGQGSRLGFDGPKGSYPIGPVSNCPLFAIHSRKILALEQKYSARIPFYIMTSRMNDADTRGFFEENSYFGLDPDRVLFFSQGMWPALDGDGKVILDEPGHVFMSPDGHGGILAALRVKGMIDDMEKRGLKHLFYYQVDNPLVEIADPAFMGMHAARNADISVKVCAKRDPQEGLGVVVVRNGRNAVVEYSELTDEQKNERLPDGELRFKFGSVAIHVFSFAFLKREAEAQLPLHIAHKKVPYCDDSGETIRPDEPNAYKFEKFIFDVLPDAEKALNVEFAREEEFSPVKNAAGADSPETSRRDMMLKFARWFEACGVDVPRDPDGIPLHKIEIDPCYALNASDLKAKLPEGVVLDGDVWLSPGSDVKCQN